MVKSPRLALKNAKPDAVRVTVVEEIPGVLEKTCRRAKFPGAARPGGYVRNDYRV